MAKEFKADLDEFHGLVDGRLVAIHDMLNTIGLLMFGCAQLEFVSQYVARA